MTSYALLLPAVLHPLELALGLLIAYALLSRLPAERRSRVAVTGVGVVAGAVAALYVLYRALWPSVCARQPTAVAVAECRGVGFIPVAEWAAGRVAAVPVALAGLLRGSWLLLALLAVFIWYVSHTRRARVPWSLGDFIRFLVVHVPVAIVHALAAAVAGLQARDASAWRSEHRERAGALHEKLHADLQARAQVRADRVWEARGRASLAQALEAAGGSVTEVTERKAYRTVMRTDAQGKAHESREPYVVTETTPLCAVFAQRVQPADPSSADEACVVAFRLQHFRAPSPRTLAAWSVVAEKTAATALGVLPSAVRFDAETGVLYAVRRGPVLATGEAPEPVAEVEPEAREDLSPLAAGMPPLTLLPEPRRNVGRPNEGRTVSARVVAALGALGIAGAQVDTVDVGPAAIAVTVRPPTGVRGSQILKLQVDLAIELAAPALRMMPSPDRPGCVVAEVPRSNPEPVAIRSVVAAPEFRGAKGALPIAFGVDTSGHVVTADLAALPHLLGAGATGSGKTVALHGLIVSLLLRLTPEELRLVVVDPKWTEFSAYDGLPHLLAPCITEIPATVALLTWLAGEMDKRYKLLAKAGVQDLASFNHKTTHPLPRIVAVADEVADVMLAGKKDQREEVQRLLARLLAKARAAGIHCVLGTQRPTADVLPGLIKSNAPARLALAVQSELDSRIIMDQPGAEALAGHGDALVSLPGARSAVRVQAPYCPREVAAAVTAWWAERRPVEYDPVLITALAAAGMEVPTPLVAAPDEPVPPPVAPQPKVPEAPEAASDDDANEIDDDDGDGDEWSPADAE